MIVKSTLALLVATSSIAVPTTIAPELTVEEIQLESTRAKVEEYARSYSEKCVAYVDEIIKYEWDYETVVDVMWNESHCNPVAHNPRDSHNGCMGSTGLIQAACIHAPRSEMEIPEKNIAMGYKLYSESGWKPWGVCLDGKVDCGL